MDLVDRLHRRLLEAVRRVRPEPLPAAFTIAEVYQRLIPYRALRAELGSPELAQYEHALLRLLAGERGYLRVRDPEAAGELRRELRSASPIAGIYRDYARVLVEVLDAPDPAAEPEPSAPPPSAPEPSAPVPPAAPAASCRRCRTPLPPVDGLRFCPECGMGQVDAPCPECGTVLRPEWRFCIRCGSARHAG